MVTLFIFDGPYLSFADLPIWRVTDVAEGQRINYTWEYGGLEGSSKLTWELARLPSGSKLTLTHSGIETFPQDDPNFSRDAAVAGWTYFVKESLKDYLDKAFA